MRYRERGFSLIEMLAVIAIIGLLSTIVTLAVSTVTKKGRDAKRKATIAQIGRFFSGNACFMPDGGAGKYDVSDVWAEIKATNPQYAQFLADAPRDPLGGTAAVSKYRYAVNGDASSCALYANLEFDDEPITIEGLSTPTPGGGTGTLRAAADGPNGSPVWFQISNK